jgi:hypothetical protein
MKIKNVGPNTVSIGDLRQPTGTGRGIVLSPGSEITVYDEDAERSAGLQALMSAGIVTKSGGVEPHPSLEKGTYAAPIVYNSDTPFLSESYAAIDAALASNAYAAEYTTMTVSKAQTNDVSVFGDWVELYINGTTDLTHGSNYGAIWGNLEISGTVVGTNSSCHMGAFIATVIAPSTLTNNSILAGVVADTNLTTGMTNNYVTAGFAAIKSLSHPTKKNWDTALYMTGVDSALTFETGTAYEDGVKVTAITNISTTASGVMKVVCRSTATTYYVPLWAASQLDGE